MGSETSLQELDETLRYNGRGAHEDAGVMSQVPVITVYNPFAYHKPRSRKSVKSVKHGSWIHHALQGEDLILLELVT